MTSAARRPLQATARPAGGRGPDRPLDPLVADLIIALARHWADEDHDREAAAAAASRAKAEQK